MKTLKSKGFTLIELLVVVAIIGVLATIVLASLSDARARARDAKRLADIRTIQTALEVYHLDNGSYPGTGSWSFSHDYSWDTLETLMETTLPVDPVNENPGSTSFTYEGTPVYGYFSSSSSSVWCNGQAYMLVFNLESRKGNGPNDGIQNCYGDTYEYSNAFVVGVDNDGNFKTPDTSGDLRE
jgi:prepilin-type N-terminal cleavage/methylation domain-containing protein